MKMLYHTHNNKNHLALMYGGEENIPPVSPRAAAGFQPLYPPAGENSILRESALYFLPDRVRRPAESVALESDKGQGGDQSPHSKVRRSHKRKRARRRALGL